MSIYPGAVATDANLYIAVNNLATILNGSLGLTGDNTSGNGIAVTSTVGFPSTGFITVDQEVISYTGLSVFSGNPVFTGIVRAQDGTLATLHSSGIPVSLFVIAAHHNALKNEIEAIEQDLSNRLGITSLAVITPPVGGVRFQDTEVTPKTVIIKAPTTVTSSYTLNLPVTQGGASTFLENDGSGNLSWQTAGASGVTSVTNSDGTLTISPTTGSVIASLNLGHSNTWTVLQTFSPSGIAFNDTEGSPKTVTVEAPTTITTSYTVKLPVLQGSASTFLQNDGAGNLSWAAGGSGSVGSGTTGQVAYYASSGTTVTGTNQINIDNGLTGNLTTKVFTTAGSLTIVLLTDNVWVINKASGAPTIVNLPSSPTTGAWFTIKDGKGDAATNNITITPASGTIDGASTFVINSAYQSETIVYNGSEWNII